VLALALGALPAFPVPRPAEETIIGGKAYVRVMDWARSHDLEMHWLKRDETLEMNNHSSRLTLEVDSREAELNGVKVWLSLPVVERNGGAYLAQLDLRTTIQPLLWPRKGRPGAGVRLVCLDPGHGGNDPGYCVGSRQEKKYTLLLAQQLRDQLGNAGLKVMLTRTRDKRVELSARPELAKQRNADLFISLHFNAVATSASSVEGAEVYCMTPPGAASTNARGEGSGTGVMTGNRYNDENLLLAYSVQKALAHSGVAERGVKRARFEVLREAGLPAILIEAGFLSHPVEGRRIADAAYRRRLAQAICDGVMAYKRAVE